MNIKQQLEFVLKNLNALNGRKKIGLGLGLVIIVTGVLALTAVLNKPATTPLYSNLTRQDINSMSRVLSENGIHFVLSSDNGTIEVSPGMITKARITLAEYGLPSSPESGYELFDKVNTLGLTSFMQEITNKRAIQGELARTIQMIAGVNSARIHLVTPDKNIFRRNGEDQPSASLVLKTFGQLPSKTILAIRHMVAAAVPGLETGNVTIVGADGALLTSKGDNNAGGFSRLVEMENEFEREAQNKIASALGAHLGSANFRITVSAKLNSDKRRIDETTFDPDSRVERSVQTVRETGNAENKATSQPASITQNLPDETNVSGSGQSSLENKERREETTNYEINMKKTTLVSDGYKVEKLSVALVVNKKRITELLGDKPEQKDIDVKIKELEDVVRSSVSLSSERGDIVNISFVEFLPDEINGAEPPPSMFMTLLNGHLGAIINAIGLIVGAVALAILGIRPLLTFLQTNAPVNSNEISGQLAQSSPETQKYSHNNKSENNADLKSISTHADPASGSEIDLAEISLRETRIKDQLDQLVNNDEERAVLTLRHWLQDDLTKQSAVFG